MSSRRLLVIVALLLVGGVAMTLPGSSSATFTALSNNPSTVSAATDWTPPTVTLQSPGASVKDTVTLTASASDGESGIKDAVFEYVPAAGGSWVALCTDTTSPYTCSWDTRLVPDGSYDLRVRATDNSGYSTRSDSVRTVVANTFSVVLGDPGDVIRGSVPLTVTLHNPSILPSVYRIEYAVAGSGRWVTIPACSNLSSPYTCTWNTTTVNTDYYDLRAVAVTTIVTTYSEVRPDVLVDNVAPIVSMTDPGSPLSGTRTFAATASDADSGIAKVVIQYAATGTSTYKDLCTIVSDPFSCRIDTTTFAGGSYVFRAIATDVAGNTTTSAVVTNRMIDNTVSSVSVEDPGPALTGTVSLTAAASSTAGVTSVRIQRAASGTGTWVDVCTDATAPYLCSWNTTGVPNGDYDLRAVLLDGAGKTTTSATVAARRVDNSPLRAVDVQSTNGGATPGRLENGDSISFTYSAVVQPGSISPGWAGAPLAVQVRVRDAAVSGSGADALDVLRGSASVSLGSVNLRADLVRKSRTVQFNATMTTSTATVGGVLRTTVTLQLGTIVSGSGLRTGVAASMIWTPSGLALSESGAPCSTVAAVESGSADRDF